MKLDLYSRFLLGLLVLCLALLVAQRFGLGAAGLAAAGDTAASGPRFWIAGMAASVFRVDNETGEVWRLSQDADAGWTPIHAPGEGGEESTAAESSAPTRPPNLPSAREIRRMMREAREKRMQGQAP